MHHPFLPNFLAFAGLTSLQDAGFRCDADQYDLLVACARRHDLDPWNQWRRAHPDQPVWLSGSDLRGLVLHGADLREAHLELANLYKADLHGADLRSARIWTAYLSGATLSGADLEDADLRSSRARALIVDERTHLWHCLVDAMTDFSGTPLDGVRIDPKLKREILANIETIDEHAWFDGRRPRSVSGQVLHLSDLHFGTTENAVTWYSQLAEDLARELECTKLDAVILSGDVANLSTPDEYAAARVFLESVRAEFDLSPQQIILVPGNHDLHWPLARKAYKIVDRTDYAGKLEDGRVIDNGGDGILVRDEALYPKRFEHFAAFYQSVRGEPYPLDPAEQGLLYHLPGLNLLVLGLNSAWNLDHHYRSRAEIYPRAVANALDRIRKAPAYKDCFKVAVWHHPVNSAFEDRITDQGFLEQLAKAGFNLGLHGHIHKAQNSLFRYDLSAAGRRLELVCAGTFGAPVKEWVPGYPLQYQLLRFAGNKLTVETRRREEINGAWKPDARWITARGKDPAPRYTIQFSNA